MCYSPIAIRLRRSLIIALPNVCSALLPPDCNPDIVPVSKVRSYNPHFPVLAWSLRWSFDTVLANEMKADIQWWGVPERFCLLDRDLPIFLVFPFFDLPGTQMYARRGSSRLRSRNKNHRTERQKNLVSGRHPCTAFLAWACCFLRFFLHKKNESLCCLRHWNRFLVNEAEMQS